MVSKASEAQGSSQTQNFHKGKKTIKIHLLEGPTRREIESEPTNSLTSEIAEPMPFLTDKKKITNKEFKNVTFLGHKPGSHQRSN